MFLEFQGTDPEGGGRGEGERPPYKKDGVFLANLEKNSQEVTRFCLWRVDNRILRTCFPAHFFGLEILIPPTFQRHFCFNY